METAKIAKTLEGDKLYQKRARAALPVLVRQAQAGAKIFYADLADELRIPNARNLNYPLGSIGAALESLSKSWGEKVPQIQCLVVNQATGLPGEGIGWFFRDKGKFNALPRRAQRAIVDSALSAVFAYPRWYEVLAALGLQPIAANYKAAVDSASKYGAGGESPFHKALKKYVAETPSVIGLPDRAGPGKQEEPLPSGDSIDVSFSHLSVRTAVEVKSRISPYADIARGIFQCVKYRAVLGACVSAESSDDAVDSVLVLEGSLPDDLKILRNILEVTVVEKVQVPLP